MKRLLLVFLFLGLLGALVAGVAIVAGGGSSALSVAPRQFLALGLSGALPEHRLDAELPFVDDDAGWTMSDLYAAFRAALVDPRVVGLEVEIDDLDVGFAKAQELRRQLGAFVAAGKPVRCYLETAGEGRNGTLEYYLATACSSIALAPAGEVGLLGLNLESAFLRGALEKLAVDPSFLHVGEYKSAAEVFTEREHSPAAREALGALLDSSFEEVVSTVATARSLARDRVLDLIDTAPHGADAALSGHLVDELSYPAEFRAASAAAFGSEPAARLDFDDYARRGDARAPSRALGDKIAVLYATGTIVRGRGGVEPWTDEAFLGSDDLAEEARRLAEDDSVKAVVLRVDSPGGSALASDLMLHELELLAAEKPLVVSMSDVAASGGYYIAAKATKIVAEAGTLTGSIGVVGGKLATGRGQEKLLGITHEALRRGRRAGIYSTLAPFSEDERAALETRMRETYDRFLGHVAAGRELAREAVAAVAEGRVWTGRDALARGLVDELGGLGRAVALAEEAAGVDAGTLPLVYLPEPPNWYAWLVGRGGRRLDSDTARLLGRWLRALRAAEAPFALELPPELARAARPL